MLLYRSGMVGNTRQLRKAHSGLAVWRRGCVAGIIMP